VASTVAKNNVSILTVRQEGRGADAELVVLTHVATESALANTLKDLQQLDVVKQVVSMIRVEGLM